MLRRYRLTELSTIPSLELSGRRPKLSDEPQTPAQTLSPDRLTYPGDPVKRLITHAGEAYRTGDELANAVCHYSLVLARVGAIDTVDIPVLNADDVTCRAQLVVGWRRGVVGVSERDDVDGPDDIATVLDIYSRAAEALPRGRAFGDDEIENLQWPDS